MAILFVADLTSAQSPHTMLQSYLKTVGKNNVHSIHFLIETPDTLFADAVGFSDGKKLNALPDDRFKIASMTKTLTATVILQLMEEERLKLDDPIDIYLKDIYFVKVDQLHQFGGKSYGTIITIKQLLQHRSGLADIFTDAAFRFNVREYFNRDIQWNPAKLMRQYYHYNLNKKAHFVPGNSYYYSDVNYFLLGIIIEKITGQSLAQQFRTRILDPLAMNSTYLEFYEPPRGISNIAHSFLGKIDVTKKLNTSYDWAGGGIVSNNYDLAKFLKGLFTCKLFKKKETLDEMTTMIPHRKKLHQTGYYGLGLFQYEYNGTLFYGHSGFWGSTMGYSTEKKILFCGTINQVNAPFKSADFICDLLRIFDQSSSTSILPRLSNRLL